MAERAGPKSGALSEFGPKGARSRFFVGMGPDLIQWETLICHFCILRNAARGHRVAWYPTGLGVL